MKYGVVVAGLLGIFLCACDGSTGVDDVMLAKATPCHVDADGARTVVAVIDSAMNPYHEFFHANSPIYPGCSPSSVTPEVLAELGVPPENIIEVTRTGNISKDKKADAAIWSKVQRGKPYWFKGTNLVGVSFINDKPLIPDAAKNPHGVGTSAAVLIANPDAVILFVEAGADNLGAAETEEFAFFHPAVDIVSMSYGPSVGGVVTSPQPSPREGSYDGVVKLGKFHFNASGNSPGFTPAYHGGGYWWSINVSGFEEYSSNGHELLSSDAPDFVSDFTQELPYCQDCERGLEPGVGGTSFSCPRGAGVFSRVLLEARRLLGHGGPIRIHNGVAVMAEGNGKSITNWQIRRAMEEAAYADYGVADFDPTALDTAIPVNDAAPWLHVAWGDLTADPEKKVVPEALAHLGFGTPTRFKDEGFCEYNAALMRFRQAFWDANPPGTGGDDTVPDPNPYLFCDSAVP